MPSSESSAQAPAGTADTDGLSCLTEGVHAYLQEIDDYRAVCRRHEGTAVVRQRRSQLQVARFFKNTSETATHLQSALRQLAALQGDHGRRDGGKDARRWRRHSTQEKAWRCQIVWAGRLLSLDAYRSGETAILQVNLHVPCVPRGDLPELPLRLLAEALRCHEFLLPDVVTAPLPVPPRQAAAFVGLREYLLRVTPPNLLASQCI